MTVDPSDPEPPADPFGDTELPEELISGSTLAGGEAEQKARVRAALFHGRPLAPDRIGRFILLGTLGEGGMGTVLEAYDEALDRKVAVKLLHPSVAERSAKRLVREAQALAKLSHPNVVQVYEVGEVEGRTFIAMEMVRGETLQAWQRQAPRPGWRACVDVYLQAGQGLAAAHAVGLVHRDFKPSNCIIDDEGRMRVLDFGLVREIDAASIDEPSTASRILRPADDAFETSLTRTGTVLGTVAYMPLEQLDGKLVDARGDQFSFCVSLYEAVYGERPFEGETLGMLTMALVKGQVRPPPPRGSSVPSKLRRLLVRGLARDPAKRWPSMQALLAELQRLAMPRTRQWAALVLGLGLLAVGVASWLRLAEVTVQQRCDGAETRLVDVWDQARKQQVEASLLATGKTFAPRTWERVEAHLDDYAAAWVSHYTAVCEAAGELDGPPEEDTARKFRCLGERRVAMRDTVDLLANADDELLVEAVELVTKLPGLERCDDIEALRADLPPPEDPEVAAEVEQLRERLSKIETLGKAAKILQQAEEAEAVVVRAEAIGYPPLLAEALLARGHTRRNNATYDEARRDLEHAYALGVEQDHARVAREAALLLTRIVGHHQSNYELGMQWGQTALALASRPKAEEGAKAEALAAISIVLHEHGKHDEALDYLKRALELKEAALGDRHPDVAKILVQLAGTLLESGKREESVDYYRRAASIHESAAGGPNQHTVDALGNFSLVLAELERYDEALGHARRAEFLVESSWGSDHPLMAGPWLFIGEVLFRQGKPEEAIDYLERSLQLGESSWGLSHPILISSIDLLGAIHMERREHEQALRYFERSLAISEATWGPDNRRLTRPLAALTNLLFQQGRPEEALVYAKRSTAIAEASVGPEHIQFAEGLRMQGDCLRMMGKLDDALESYRRGLAIAESSALADSSVPEYLYGIADTLLRQGRFDESLDNFRRLLAMVESATGPQREDERYFAIIGMAEVELERHEPEAAQKHAERALSMHDAGKLDLGGPGARQSELAWARFLLAQALWRHPKERSRARALAEQARDALVSGGQGLYAEHTERVQAWLTRHPAP